MFCLQVLQGLHKLLLKLGQKINQKQQYKLRHNTNRFQINSAETSNPPIMNGHNHSKKKSKYNRKQHCYQSNPNCRPHTFQKPQKIISPKQHLYSQILHTAPSFLKQNRAMISAKAVPDKLLPASTEPRLFYNKFQSNLL